MKRIKSIFRNKDKKNEDEKKDSSGFGPSAEKRSHDSSVTPMASGAGPVAGNESHNFQCLIRRRGDSDEEDLDLKELELMEDDMLFAHHMDFMFHGSRRHRRDHSFIKTPTESAVDIEHRKWELPLIVKPDLDNEITDWAEDMEVDCGVIETVPLYTLILVSHLHSSLTLSVLLPQWGGAPSMICEARPRYHHHPSLCCRYSSWDGMELVDDGRDEVYPGIPGWSGMVARIPRNLSSSSLLKVARCLQFAALIVTNTSEEGERGRRQHVFSSSGHISYCIVHHKLTFETFATRIPIHAAAVSRNSIPTIVVKDRGGNTQTINLNQLQFGKWTYGLLNLGSGTVPKFIPMDDDANLGDVDDDNNNNVNDASMVRSQITLDGRFFYTYCAKATPNFVTDYKFYYQLPRTGHTEEEILLYPSVDAKHNITMHIGGEEWVVCKVNGEAVVRKVSEGPCAPVDEKLLKLRLSFPDDKKMEMELDGKNAVTVSLTEDYESVFFKQLEPDVAAKLVYVQCAGTCPDPDDTPVVDSSNTALIIVSVFLAIFIVLSLLLICLRRTFPVQGNGSMS
ncbi:hypothetical protein Pcinc_025376 [Petrolisthes cinctipes]|uniref:Uncharacterized protein n=1 Tax=Petrolisthes cinctipes TaxID=88211 RepID=A0AAE1F9C0_PETCI|nr:hypothetical protein Pcinc_025376 [Petrolisthes cinctipes]